MPTIKLIVTGAMEKAALHQSLQKLFPEKQDGITVEWPTPNQAYPATSAKLRNTNEPAPKMVDLANTMIAEVLYSKTGKAPDLVMVIDDLELHNAQQEKLVAHHFRLAIDKAISKSEKYRVQEEKIRQLIRTHCSFHLLKPMVEAYLFGDAQAIRIATNLKPISLPPGLDLEHFETNDPDYLRKCHQINHQRAVSFPNWREECHPKHYIQYLNPDYRETDEGKNALLKLNWANLADNNSHLQVIRALLTDLSDWFKISNPLPGIAHPIFWPAHNTDHSALMLRNL
jgi:hypothetical protein